MPEISLNTNQNISTFKSLSLKYMLILFSGYVIAFLTAPSLWEKRLNLMHTIMELICIFIALYTFLIIWNSYKKSFDIYYLLGFGFLSVAVFDSFHTYYWFVTNELSQEYHDLTTRYWIIGRLVEALVLAVFSLRKVKIRICKYSGLFFVLVLSFGLASAVQFVPGLMPVMLTDKGVTPLKIALEYVVIGLTLFSLYGLRDRFGDDAPISYKNVIMALLFIIPAELSFTMYKVVTNFQNMYGHILKIICYYFLYKAVYASCVEYPYKKLEEAYDQLENTNAKIKEIGDIMNDTLDALPIGILNYEKDNRIKYMNKRLEEILACDRNALYGLTLEDLLNVFHEVEREEENIIEIALNSGEEPISRVRTYKNLNGEYVKLSLVAQNIGNGILVYLNEVKKEQDIKNFHLQTQTILNAVNNCVLMVDQNMRIILTNKSFQKVFEAEDVELTGMDISKFNEMVGIDNKRLPYTSKKVEELNQANEISITTLKGNKRQLLEHFAAITNVEEEIIGWIVVFTDITEMKKQQHSMQQQEKLALIGQMAAGIVHEIKNPLSTIKGLSQLINAKATSDKVKKYSVVIDSAIDDANKVVNEFLSFAKPRPTVKTRTSINGIVESMQLITETQCYTKNIKSCFSYCSCPMQITADETKIKQVILNITENAIAAMECAELPELVVSTHYEADSKEGVISISDNGKGMSPEVIAKLGTPYFTTKEKGTGLGLGICYQIMSEHSGRIEVESEEGKGTTFKIIFSQIEDLI